MTVARKNHGNCDLCGLPIMKGDEWTWGADYDDLIETKKGTKVRPGAHFDSFHMACMELINVDGDGYSDPQETLEESVMDAYDLKWTEKGIEWKAIIKNEPKEHYREFDRWRSFILPRLEAV